MSTYKIVLGMFDDGEQKDKFWSSKPTESSQEEIMKEARKIYDSTIAEPGDDRYGVTVLQQVIMNVFGGVSEQWWGCAWIGKNQKYLVDFPKAKEAA